MVEIPFCVFLRMKMHTKIHFIRKNAANKLAEIRQWPLADDQWPPGPDQNQPLGRKFTYKTHLLEVILCHLYVNLHIKWSLWPKCDPKGSKMHVFLRTK